MTWLADAQKNRPTEADREELLARREVLVNRIAALSITPLPSKSQASIDGRLEDLKALASKVKNIDKKLGRA